MTVRARVWRFVATAAGLLALQGAALFRLAVHGRGDTERLLAAEAQGDIYGRLSAGALLRALPAQEHAGRSEEALAAERDRLDRLQASVVLTRRLLGGSPRRPSKEEGPCLSTGFARVSWLRLRCCSSWAVATWYRTSPPRFRPRLPAAARASSRLRLGAVHSAPVARASVAPGVPARRSTINTSSAMGFVPTALPRLPPARPPSLARVARR